MTRLSDDKMRSDLACAQGSCVCIYHPPDGWRIAMRIARHVRALKAEVLALRKKLAEREGR